MPTELVLLSDVAPSIDAQAAAATSVLVDGALVMLRGDEIGMFVDAEGEAVLTVHATKPILHRAEAAASLVDAPTSFALWTEMTIPFAAPDSGRRVADAIAAAVGGTIAERA